MCWYFLYKLEIFCPNSKVIIGIEFEVKIKKTNKY
jgi:hypothetical protein